MIIVRICGIAFASAVLAAALKRDMPVFSLLAACAGGIIILLYALPYAGEALSVFGDIAAGQYTVVIFKAVGIAYAAQLTSQLCADAGFGSVGARIELAGKILILSLSIPILRDLMTVITEMLG